MTIQGIDAAWSRPTPDQMLAAGVHFIIGYVSRDPAKNLTASECAAYLAAGIGVGLVWETTSDRALAGATAGHLDGQQARQQARALGFPAGRPIFAAVDFLASVGQLAGPVREYLIAFAEAVGGVELAGVYGGLDTVRYALNTKIVGWGWQTYAWSHGVWDPRAQIQQYRNGVSIAGHDTDLDRAADLAAFWTKGNTDMTITPSDAHVVWAGSLEIPNMPDQSKPNVTPATATAQVWGTVLGVNPHTDTAVAAAVAEINAHTDAVLAAAPIPPGGTLTQADLDAIVAALRPVVREEIDAAINATHLTTD